jgi:predicted TIM-barrel fold metal-dependent hydrolase
MARRAYRIVSADTHVLEPPDIWTNHLPAEYQDDAPKLVKDLEGGDAWQFAGVADPDPIGLVSTPGKRFEEFRWHGATYDDIRAACHNGKERVRDMDIDGVDAEVTFPPQRTISHWLGHPDRDVSLAGVDAYNDFVFNEFAAADRDRIYPMYQIPCTGVDDAVAYVEKAVRQGAKGVVISAWPNGGESIDEEDDRFWAACVDEGFPVTIHINLISRAARTKAQTSPSQATAGVRKGASKANQRAIGGMAGVFAAIPPAMGYMIYSGLFDRFPELHISLIETGVGWIPHFVEQLDDRYWRNRGWGEITIKEPPSTYWRENFSATFIVDFNGVSQRHAVGVRNMMWSTDYPHHGNDWPYSRMTINEMFAGVDESERSMILAGNAVRIFGLGT